MTDQELTEAWTNVRCDGRVVPALTMYNNTVHGVGPENYVGIRGEPPLDVGGGDFVEVPKPYRPLPGREPLPSEEES